MPLACSRGRRSRHTPERESGSTRCGRRVSPRLLATRGEPALHPAPLQHKKALVARRHAAEGGPGWACGHHLEVPEHTEAGSGWPVCAEAQAAQRQGQLSTLHDDTRTAVLSTHTR
jgi:hypothetical protein